MVIMNYQRFVFLLLKNVIILVSLFWINNQIKQIIFNQVKQILLFILKRFILFQEQLLIQILFHQMVLIFILILMQLFKVHQDQCFIKYYTMILVLIQMKFNY
jgi:hypothetical protein